MAVLLLRQDSTWVQHPLGDGEMLVGRHPECQVRLDRSIISSRHARLFKDGDHYWLEDLGSRNGTSRNGQMLEGRVRLEHDDEIRFAHTVVARFHEHHGSSAMVDYQEDGVVQSAVTVNQVSQRIEASGDGRLKAVLDITDSLAGTLDVATLLPKVLDSLFRIFPRADRGCILLRDDGTGEMIPRVSKTRGEKGLTPIALSSQLIDRVLHQQAGVLCEDAAEDFAASQSIAALAIRSILCVPIPDGMGQPIGLINLDSQRVRQQFTVDDLDLLTIVAGQIGLSLENARLMEKLIEEHQHRFEIQRQREKLEKYFSPTIVEKLHQSASEDDFEPQLHQITVLFCDIRGFSLRAERSAHDLRDVLKRCTEALEVMTRHILDKGGNISDFQGDAALGYWGWPVNSADGPLSACRAALAIDQAFVDARNDPDHLLADFHVGIGIAHGTAIAGKIGSTRQAKIGVFGPPINLGARLESMTKELRVPILVCEATAEFARQHMLGDLGRLRRLARVQPYGLETPLAVHQLLPPAEMDAVVTDEVLSSYEAAVDAFAAGDWTTAYDLLGGLPVADRAQDFLLHAMLEHGHEPPADWDGVHRMKKK